MKKRILVAVLTLLTVSGVASALDVYGELKSALFENLTSNPTAYDGRVYHETDADLVHWYTGGAWSDAVTTDQTQTLTNKTLTSPKLNENVAVTTTATQLNYLGAATGTTGTTSTNVVFSTSPALTTPSFTTSATYTNQAEARYAEQTGNGTNYVGFSAPAAVTANKIFKLPDGDGSADQVLKTDGSLQLGWASVLTNPLTTTGDILYTTSGATPNRLAAGADNRVLGSNGAGVAPTYQQIDDPAFFTAGAAAGAAAIGIVTTAQQSMGGLKLFLGGGSFIGNVRGDPGGTVTLTDADNRHQIFTTISASRTVTMPTTSIKAGDTWIIENYGTGDFDMIINASGGSAITPANGANLNATIQRGYVMLIANQDTPTTPAHWLVSYVEEFKLHRTQWTFAGTATITAGTGSKDVRIRRVNNWVQIYVPDNLSTTSASATGTANSDTDLDTRFQPELGTTVYISVRDNGTAAVTGQFAVTAAGNMSISKTTTNFAGGAGGATGVLNGGWCGYNTDG